MKWLKACVEGFAILAITLTIVGGIVAFVAFAAAAAQIIGVWVFPTVIGGAYLLFVTVIYLLKHKVVKKREVPSVGTNNPSSGGPSGVVKLRDDTVATAILEAKQRERDADRQHPPYA
jgi:membrane protein implicated in regulation of membrane protease activity